MTAGAGSEMSSLAVDDDGSDAVESRNPTTRLSGGVFRFKVALPNPLAAPAATLGSACADKPQHCATDTTKHATPIGMAGRFIHSKTQAPARSGFETPQSLMAGGPWVAYASHPIGSDRRPADDVCRTTQNRGSRLGGPLGLPLPLFARASDRKTERRSCRLAGIGRRPGTRSQLGGDALR